MIAEMKANARCLGWGFLLAWVFCVFYSGSMDGLSVAIGLYAQDVAQQLAVSALPVGSAVAALAVAAAVERRWGPPTNSRAVVVGAPIAVAVATPVLLLPVYVPVVSAALFVLAAVVTGVGSGLMWVMWGQLYARMPQDVTELCAPVSALCAAVLSFAAMALPSGAAMFLVAAYPLASGMLFWSLWPRASEAAPSDHASSPAKPRPLREAFASMGRGGFGILAACFFVSIEGSFWNASAANAVQAAGVFVVSALFMLIVSLTATAGPRRVSLAFAYRWMCPLMVAGFSAMIVLDSQAGLLVAAGVGIASRFAFCVITQMYFASYAARGAATPVQSYAVGWLFVHVGDLLGVLASVPLQHAVDVGAVELTSVAAVLIVLLVGAVMLALNDGSMFLAWETPVQAPAQVVIPASCEAVAGDVASEAVESGECEKERSDDLLASAKANESVALRSGGADAPAAASQAEATQPPTDFIGQRVALLAAEHKLTPRETEVFGLLAHGRSIPYVRDALFISRDTAATHAKHIYAKLDVHSRQELIDLVMSSEL